VKVAEIYREEAGGCYLPAKGTGTPCYHVHHGLRRGLRRSTWTPRERAARYPPRPRHGERTGAALRAFGRHDAAGAGVAIESRYLEPRLDSAKGKSRGAKGRGVFVVTPGALDAPAVTVCEGPLTALSVAACGVACVALCGQKAPAWFARRVALRDVVIAFDEGERDTEKNAAALVRQLAAGGARPYRLRLGVGVDVNDYLQTHGLAATRRAIEVTLGAALGSSRPGSRGVKSSMARRRYRASGRAHVSAKLAVFWRDPERAYATEQVLLCELKPARYNPPEETPT
jgi:hypothetical protein